MDVIERVLIVALGGGLLSVIIKLGTQVPAADPVFLALVVAGGALNLYLVGALANARIAAPGRSWAWRGLIGAVIALIAQAFSDMFGNGPAAWDALLLTAPLWGGLGGVCGLPQTGRETPEGEKEHESA
jgi:hypothetical protein